MSVKQKQPSKKEMVALAQQMIRKDCYGSQKRKEYCKLYPANTYDTFHEIYLKVVAEQKAKKTRDKDRKAISLVASRIKVPVKAFTYVVNLVRNVDLSMFKTGHSMGYTATLCVDKFPALVCDGRITPPKAYKYKPTYGYYSVQVDRPAIMEMAKGYTFGMVGGIPTFIEPTNAKVKKAFWLVEEGRKHNYGVKLIEGFLTNDYHNVSYDSCVEWRSRMAQRLIQSRRKIAFEKLSAEEKAQRVQEIMKRFVGLEHSIQAGNCKEGTEAFAKKFSLDISMGYTIEYLLSLEDSPFTRRLLNSF